LPKLCVTYDGIGNGFFTTNPTAAMTTWTQATVEKPRSALGGEIACPSTKLCVVANTNGLGRDASRGVQVRVEPFKVNGSSSLSGIACPTAKLCVALSSAGDQILGDVH
jgi:hypothetical protein